MILTERIIIRRSDARNPSGTYKSEHDCDGCGGCFDEGYMFSIYNGNIRVLNLCHDCAKELGTDLSKMTK